MGSALLIAANPCPAEHLAIVCSSAVAQTGLLLVPSSLRVDLEVHPVSMCMFVKPALVDCVDEFHLSSHALRHTHTNLGAWWCMPELCLVEVQLGNRRGRQRAWKAALMMQSAW